MAEELFHQLSQIEGFEKISQESQSIFKKACEQQNPKSNLKKIYIKSSEANLLYCDGTFDIPEIQNILKFFDFIDVEINYSSKVFNELLDIFSSMVPEFINDGFIRLDLIVVITTNKDGGLSLYDSYSNIMEIRFDPTYKSDEMILFKDIKSLAKVTLPPTLTTIYHNMFSKC